MDTPKCGGIIRLDKAPERKKQQYLVVVFGQSKHKKITR